jgi:hypothetical protein
VDIPGGQSAEPRQRVVKDAKYWRERKRIQRVEHELAKLARVNSENIQNNIIPENNITPNIPAPELPEALPVPSDGPPAVEAAPEIEPQPESNPEAVQAEQSAIEADAAAQALKAQLAAHRQAETLQAQHQATAMAQQQAPTTREEKLAAWNLSEAETKFLTDHPEMLDNDRVLAAAIQTATRAGINRDAPEFLPKVKANFDVHLQRFQRQAAAQSPEFFRPTVPTAPSRPSPASYTSAPVSREASGERISRPGNSKVRLSAEEMDMARLSGISVEEYARQKLTLQLKKQSGEIV